MALIVRWQQERTRWAGTQDFEPADESLLNKAPFNSFDALDPESSGDGVQEGMLCLKSDAAAVRGWGGGGGRSSRGRRAHCRGSGTRGGGGTCERHFAEEVARKGPSFIAGQCARFLEQ